VAELAHLEVQNGARRSTMMRRPHPPVCQLRNVSVVAAVYICEIVWENIYLFLKIMCNLSFFLSFQSLAILLDAWFRKKMIRVTQQNKGVFFWS
jgi:hypothetical protein